jgi:hypothetical protein
MLQRAGSCCAFGLEAGCFCCAYTRLLCLYSAYNRLAVQVETAVLPLLWIDSRCRLFALVTCDRRTGSIYVHKTVTAPIMLTPVTPARTALCLVGSLAACQVSSSSSRTQGGQQVRQGSRQSHPAHSVDMGAAAACAGPRAAALAQKLGGFFGPSCGCAAAGPWCPCAGPAEAILRRK